MTLFGTHGGEAVSLIFLTAAAPFALLIWFENRFDPDTYVVIGTLYGVLGIAGCLFGLIAYTQRGDTGSAAICAAGIVILVRYLYSLWKKWKNRKKVLAALGAKSKALRDALVRRMREAQPEGAQ
jgi:peptidoglycan/LPS O-acetylase OafA/YrhL